MGFIVLPLRGNYTNFIKSTIVAKPGQLIIAYKDDGHRIYKIGDGKSNFSGLPEVDLNTIDDFNIYDTSGRLMVTVYLDPRKFEEIRDGKDI